MVKSPFTYSSPRALLWRCVSPYTQNCVYHYQRIDNEEWKMIHILIADQHTLMRSGIQRLLSDEPGLSVIAEVGRIEQVLATMRLGKIDVLLMDVNLPGLDSVEATRRLLRMDDELKIIALGAHASGPYAVHLFKAGIAGYLTKASSGEEMIACIRKVVRGQRHVSPDIAQTLLLEHIQNGDAPLGCLTQRELSVLVLLSQGHQRLEISTKLCVSPKTISTYRTRLMRKLGARSDVELTHLSLRHGLVSPIEGRAP